MIATEETKLCWFVSLCPLRWSATTALASGAPAHDDCANAIPIFTGTTAYDTTMATTDGPAHPDCATAGDGGATVHDIWFLFTATCNGRLTVTTCEQLGGSVTYDIDLVVYDTTACPPTDADVLGCNDGHPDNPCGDYDCVTVHDPLHSLATNIDLNVSGAMYVGAMPAINTGGNLNGDQFIDILDFGIFIGQFSDTVAINTPCPPAGPHADITGDGVVLTGDFTFISNNFFAAGNMGCTSLVYGGSPSPSGWSSVKHSGPIERISAAELKRRGLAHLLVADLNKVQWLDLDDVAAFIGGARP